MFKIFKKKAKPYEITWDDITLEQFTKIQEVLSSDIPDNVNKTHKLFEIVTGKSIEVTPLEVFNKQLPNVVALLKSDVSNHPMRKKYVLGNTTYRPVVENEEVTTGQYFDFYQNYGPEIKTDYAKLMSIFLVPEGHMYNDGYDLLKVQDDINKYLKVTDIYSLIFFFKVKLNKYTKRFQNSLIYEILKIKGLKLKDKTKAIKVAQTISKNMESLTM